MTIAPHEEYSRTYWEKLVEDSPGFDKLTFERSPVESWSFPRSRLISFKQPTPITLLFEFPTHYIKVYYRDHKVAEGTAELLRKILLGKVCVLIAVGRCAESNVGNNVDQGDKVLIAVSQMDGRFHGVFRVQQIDVESKQD